MNIFYKNLPHIYSASISAAIKLVLTRTHTNNGKKSSAPNVKDDLPEFADFTCQFKHNLFNTFVLNKLFSISFCITYRIKYCSDSCQ